MPDLDSYLSGLHSTLRIAFGKLFASGATLTNNLIGNVTGNVTGDVIGNITGDVTGNVEGNLLGEHSLELQAAEHGAGAIGTAFAPKTYRGSLVNGDILTSIQVDLTGLGCKGDAARDAIGLSTGGAAYIGKYVIATYGVVYKVEMLVLETPGEGTATITADIDLDADDEDDIAYDGACDGGIILNTGGIAAGNTFQNLVPALTGDDYLYLTEGDAAATTGVYNAGQVIVNLYGHPVLS